jgi:hypothetical protein
MEAMRTAKELAKEVLAYLDQESIPSAAVVRVRNACLRELAPAQPVVVEKRVAEALSILQRLGLPASRLAAFTLMAFVQVGVEQTWGSIQLAKNLINLSYGSREQAICSTIVLC